MLLVKISSVVAVGCSRPDFLENIVISVKVYIYKIIIGSCFKIDFFKEYFNFFRNGFWKNHKTGQIVHPSEIKKMKQGSLISAREMTTVQNHPNAMQRYYQSHKATYVLRNILRKRGHSIAKIG